MLKYETPLILTMTLEEDLHKALETQNRSNQDLDALRERILKGETLGDPLKDAAFVWRDYLQLEKDLQELQQNVTNNQGKQVLAIYSREIKANDDSCVVELFDRTEINGLQLGLVRGELYFDFRNNKIIIPTQEYAHKGQVNLLAHQMPSSENWMIVPGNLELPKIEYIAKHLSGNYNLQLLFGDEVELYFTNPMEFDIYQKAKNRGDHDLKGVLERRFQTIADQNYAGDPEYVKALDLINVEVPSRFKARGM